MSPVLSINLEIVIQDTQTSRNPQQNFSKKAPKNVQELVYAGLLQASPQINFQNQKNDRQFCGNLVFLSITRYPQQVAIEG